jgi:hypothetical protein
VDNRHRYREPLPLPTRELGRFGRLQFCEIQLSGELLDDRIYSLSVHSVNGRHVEEGLPDGKSIVETIKIREICDLLMNGSGIALSVDTGDPYCA